MQTILSAIFRFFTTKLIFQNTTYIMGMLVIRIARKTRRYFYNSKNQKNFKIVSNCLGNLKMNLETTSYMSGSIYWTGFHHVNEILYLKTFLKDDMTFVDIGANQGEFSLFAASCIKNGKVLAFEPVSYQLNLLKENVRLNNFTQVEIYPFGLSDKKDKLPIYTSNDSELHGGTHEGLSTLYESETRNIYQETIDLEVFDLFFENKIDKLDFIKIDIEGAELFALKGMIKHIEKFKPHILIEISQETFESAGYSVEEMLDFLYSFNYKAYKIRRGKLQPCSSINSEWGNYIFKI